MRHPLPHASIARPGQTSCLPGFRRGLSRVERRGLRAASRRGGFALVWLALMVTVFMGVAALSVDQGFHLSRKANAQKAADAAALAAAQRLAVGKSVATAVSAAEEYAALNGYDIEVRVGGPKANKLLANNINEVAMAVIHPIPGTYIPLGKTAAEAYPANWVMVKVSRREPRFFGQVFLALMRKPGDPPVDATQWVGATSIAEFQSATNMPISSGSKYGLNDGDATLSVFGPDARYANGDFRSTKNLTDGSPNNIGPNPDYHADVAGDKDQNSGYNFNINYAASMTDVKLQIFDPDCYNAPGGTGPQSDAATGVRVDEWRARESANAGSQSDATVTKYALYADNGTPNDLNDDIFLGERSFGGTSLDAQYDMKWLTVATFNRQSYPGQNFRLNVVTTGGSSENGFNIRAGRLGDRMLFPDGSDAGTGADDDTLVPPPFGVAPTTNNFANNGTSVTARGSLPINFNRSGQVTVTLGDVPAEVRDRDVTIRKFDTDVGGQAVRYEVRDAAGVLKNTFAGVLSGNGEFRTDTIRLPSNYAGGTWTAIYSAGIQDTSVWEMNFNAGKLGDPRIKLVQ